jgi:putative nucleotidyltransferase with HDIG domain
MKTNINLGTFQNLLTRTMNLSGFRVTPVLVSVIALLITVVIAAGNISGADGASDIREFEAGKVAERDVIAERALSYIDEEATRLRTEAQERLVPAVFRFSVSASAQTRDTWQHFAVLADELIATGGSAESCRLAIQAEFPSLFPDPQPLTAYFSAPERSSFSGYGTTVLNSLLDKGIFSLVPDELRKYNPDVVYLYTSFGSRMEQERIPYSRVITPTNVPEAISQIAESAGLPASFRNIAPELLKPFISENVFFSPGDTDRRVAETRESVEPVMRYIEKDQRIVRKGFIVSEEEMRDLAAIHTASANRDPRAVIGIILLVLLLYGLFILLRGKLFMGRELRDRESYLLSVLVCLYLAGSMLVKNLFPADESVVVSLVFPTALAVMIPAVFMGPRIALVFAIALPMGAFLCGALDTFAYIFALVSAVSASFAIKKAEKRMDLIKAGLIVAVSNCAAIIVILLFHHAAFAEYPAMLFWAFLNGVMSGILLLGFVAPLEYILNAATTFRLMELSDVNAPILKRLFTVAPGTYSHSILVANLAEQACQDIGANALLARVGSYYHDLGKMDNPDYFVENQTAYNKHDDIAPRLSATVIRSHVKLGVEKARSLKLPLEIIDIIAEHHGNSLITWFFDKATKQEAQVSSDDFTYPGVPPRTKEAAVVMLADVTEAAVRTLSKPTAAKIERFIQELFDAKVKHGQLANSDLSFRELEKIKNAFVKVLASYYHSRIEYPKIDEGEKQSGHEDAETAHESGES